MSNFLLNIRNNPITNSLLTAPPEDNHANIVPPFGFFNWIDNLGNQFVTNTGDHLVFNLQP